MITFDESLKKRVFLLNLTNYQQWQQKVNKLFEFLDASQHIESNNKPDDIDEQEWIQDDLAIKKFLIDRIGDENIKRLVTDIETTFEIWLKLKKICEEKSPLDLSLMLDNFKIQTNLTESIKQLEQLFEDTKSFMNTTSSYRSCKLLNSLPSYYNDFRAKYLHTDDLDYEKIKIELIDFEKNVISKMDISNEIEKIEKNDTIKSTKEQDQNNNNIQENEQINTDNHCKEKAFIIDSSKLTTNYNQQGEKIQDIRFRNPDEVNAEINSNNEKKSTNSNDYNYEKKDKKRYDSPERRSDNGHGKRNYDDTRTIRSYEKDKMMNKYDGERRSATEIKSRKSYDERIELTNDSFVNLPLFRLLQQQNTLEECQKLLKENMIKPGCKSIET